MEIKQATEFGEEIREKISELFVDAFSKELKFVKNSDLRKALISASTHLFDPKHVWLAVIDGEIAGMVDCYAKNEVPPKLRKREFIKRFGIVSGLLIGFLLGHYYRKSTFKKIPTAITSEKAAAVQMVATSPKLQGKGVATTLLNFVHAQPEYDTFILEVLDTNTNAFELYKKLGYKEIYRKKATKFERQGGMNYFLYLKYTKNS